MTPESQLCLKRLLSGDHMPYFVKIANQQEPEILYVYVTLKDLSIMTDWVLKKLSNSNLSNHILVLSTTNATSS